MLEIDGVTLACVDTANQALALRALALSSRAIRFAEVVLLTSAMPSGLQVPPGIVLREIPPLASRDDYSRFVLKSLLPHIATPHVLLVQWDGYVVNPDAFEATFLDCDYIGAKWFWFDDGMRVGNGGFSLRSRRLLEALQDPRIVLVEAEDTTIGRAFRPLLQREYAIRYADEAMADRFAFEAAYPTRTPFGFHGLYNFCRVVPEADLAALAPSFSDPIARSLQLGQLLRNCIALGQWTAAAALAQRRVAAMPGDAEATTLLRRAETERARGPIVGRNDPCPCGSGRRYKQCHGALASAAAQQVAAPPTASTATRAAQKAPRESFATALSRLQHGTATAAAPSSSALSLAQQGVEAHRRGDIDAAERAYRAALRLDNEQPLASHYLGVTLFQRMRFEEALPLLERSVERVPDEPEFHNNLGLVLAALDRNEAAITAYRRTLALAPRHATAWNNIGLALHAQNRIGEAIDAYRHAVTLAPEFAHAHWNLALALLADEQYADGWREYEWRLRIPELGGRNVRLPIPRWDGADLRGKSLLLDAEQGIGDAVQFVRFAKRLAERDVRVVVRAPAALCPLLGTVAGVDSTVAADAALPACDAELPLLSLGRMLDVGAGDIDGSPYLSADPRLRREIEDHIRSTASAGGRVGLAWAGAPHHRNDRRRSIDVAALAPLFEIPGLAWVSLQKGPRAQAIDTLPAARSMLRLDPSTELARTAALIDTLDAVVSVDTSIAHIAGALGKPVLLMLPYAADWRWGASGERSRWYSSARLFRQRAIGDWQSVVTEVGRALRNG